MTFDPSKLSSDALSECLLDFVRGRLAPEEVSAVEAAIASDPKLAEEVAYYCGLSNAVANKPETQTRDELGWARLEKAIAAEVPSVPSLPQAANDNQSFWKYAAAALAVVAALQTAFLVQGGSVEDEPGYITASAADVEAHALDIMFKADASANDMTAALRGVEAEIFEGPSALGLYAVRFETEAARDAALEALRQQDGLIESVTIR